MAGDKALVDMLCKAYSKELKAYHGYLHSYVTVTGPMESVYGEIYESFMQREMHHLEELGKKIVAMGGMPPIDYPPITAVAEAIYKGYDETLAVLQQAEIETLEMYKEIHSAADKAGDLPLVLLIEEIIQEEEEHHDELERILLDVPKEQAEEEHDELEVKVAGVIQQTVQELKAINKLKAERFRDLIDAESNPDLDSEYVELLSIGDRLADTLDEMSGTWRRDYFSPTDEIGILDTVRSRQIEARLNKLAVMFGQR